MTAGKRGGATGGWNVVLYYCCVSLAKAQAIERAGFHPAELIPVTETAPDTSGRDPSELHGMLFIGLPFGFDLDDYPVIEGTVERLIPGSVLNEFPRAVWPGLSR